MLIKMIRAKTIAEVWLQELLRHLNNGPAAACSRKGSCLIFSYDDGRHTDYTKAFPVHKAAGVPAEVCVIGSKLGSEGYLDASQMLELQAEGWEVVSHTLNHNPLSCTYLLSRVNPGDKVLRAQNAHRFQPGAECILGTGASAEMVCIMECEGGCLLLKDCVVKRHRRYEPLRISERQLYDELALGKKLLEEQGFEISNFTYPYNSISGWGVKAVEQYFASGRAGSLCRLGRPSLGCSYPGGVSRYFLGSLNFESGLTSRTAIESFLGKAACRNRIFILSAHTLADTFDTNLLEYTIYSAKKKQIAIVTRKGLLAAQKPGDKTC